MSPLSILLACPPFPPQPRFCLLPLPSQKQAGTGRRPHERVRQTVESGMHMPHTALSEPRRHASFSVPTPTRYHHARPLPGDVPRPPVSPVVPAPKKAGSMGAKVATGPTAD